MHSLNQIISEIIARIPDFDARPLALKALIKSTGNKMSLESVKALMALLNLWGAVEFSAKNLSENTTVIAKTKLSGFFLKSLARYFAKDSIIISDWQRKASLEHFDLDRTLDYGVYLLHLLERKRILELKDKFPVRKEKIALGIIKKKGTLAENDRYLMFFENASNRYKFVGGKSKPVDKSISDTIVREIVEEISENKLVYKRDFEIEKIAKTLILQNFSPSHAAFTEYEFTFFQIFLTKENLKSMPNYRWITEKELFAGVTDDGFNVGMKDLHHLLDKNISGGLKVLPNSFSKSKLAAQKSAEQDTDILQLVKNGESDSMEFKSSLCWDYNQNKQNKGIEISVIKTLAGFLKTNGGILLIGVKDDGTLLGLANDYATLKAKSFDGFFQLLSLLIADYLGPEVIMNIEINKVKHGQSEFCVLRVQRSGKPVFVKTGANKIFFVRVGNTTKELDSQDTYNFINAHW